MEFPNLRNISEVEVHEIYQKKMKHKKKRSVKLEKRK